MRPTSELESFFEERGIVLLNYHDLKDAWDDLRPGFPDLHGLADKN